MMICFVLFHRCVIEELKRLGESHFEALRLAHQLPIARFGFNCFKVLCSLMVRFCTLR